MCGILGGNIFKNIDEVKKGLTALFHRGTDGNTIFEFKNGMYYQSKTYQNRPINH